MLVELGNHACHCNQTVSGLEFCEDSWVGMQRWLPHTHVVSFSTRGHPPGPFWTLSGRVAGLLTRRMASKSTQVESSRLS